ncbi:MAG: YhdP family protein [Pseudomonadota bacterium]
MPAPTFLSNGIVRSALFWTGRLLLVLYFAATMLILVGRHWVMPEIGAWRGTIEQKLSEAIGLRVEIGDLTASWPGLHPHLVIDKLQLHDPQGKPALAFERVEAEIGWSSLLFMELRLHLLEIANPMLDIRRDASGVFHVAGLPLSGEGDSGFADWLLEQYRIVVRDARITWRDELRGAPPLELDKLNLVLRNLGRHHSIGLTAEPSGGIAARIDLRANLEGHSLNDLADWQGETYADLARLDLAALAPWVELPLELKRGTGYARLWLNFAQLLPTGLTADLQLADLNLRLQPELSPLLLSRIEGRVAGRKTTDGYFGEVKRLSLATASGIEIEPTQASLKLDTAGRGQGGELRASSIDLAALRVLAEHVPLPQNVHERLQQFAPQGRIGNLELAWQGPADAPAQWRVKGDFDALALAAHNELPGFSGISGRLEGDARSGQVSLDSHAATIVLPAVFPEPTLTLNRLVAEIGWRSKPGMTEILLQRVNFDNVDAHGEATGAYRYTGQGPGDIDLSAKLTDAAGNAVWRYMPLAVNKDARDWLRAGIIGGVSEIATLRLKGPLAEFPFRDGKGGIFQVKGLVRDATLDFAPGWPRMTGIDGELLFEGVRMRIRGQRGDIMGVALSNMLAEIPDLDAKDGEMLTVTGRAKGETQRFLDFIEASPVGARIDHFTETMKATGNGDLDLKLVMPLRHVVDTQVQGKYRFGDNRLEVLRELPPFTAVQGELSFTADELRAKNLRARFLDQPMSIEVGSQPGGMVRIGATGSLETNALRRFYGLRALEHLSGETPWRGTLSVKKPAAELSIESDLRGLSSSLPEPFNKSALAALPLSVQGRFEPQRDAWTVTLGTGAGLRLQQAGDSWRGRLAIGTAAANPTAALPAQGVALAIHVPQFDVDAWQALLRNGNGNAKPGEGLLLSSIEIRSPALRVAHRNFHDVQLQGAHSESRWKVAVASREAQGQLIWDAAGAGRIAGRLARLHLPAGEGSGAEEPTPEQASEMPAVDLEIDSFQLGELALGELKVKAENRDGAWQAKLDVKNEAAKLSGDGTWRLGRAGSKAAETETALAFKLEVNNVEKLLDRMGMPDAVRRGEGDLEGDIRWAGSPFAFDLPSLAGSLKADVRKGQFKKLEPGVGRLLGVLSLQSLPRRITLDFRDIFSEGFAFDSISGKAKINKGVMATDELRIRGPSAQVLLSGEADLLAETQNLKVRVQPAIGETLAVGAMIANPVAGAVAWAAQKVLKDPIDQIFAFEYAVTGGWKDPQVAKISRQFPAPAPNAP